MLQNKYISATLNYTGGKMKSKENFILYIPKIVHKNYTVDNGRVTLIFEHNKIAERFARWLVKKSNISDIEFDENCSAAWLLIDGKRNLYEIAAEMSGKTGDSIDISTERLVMYIRYLYKKGWIRFISVKDK